MIAAIIQVRLSSTRLPNKTLLDIMGKPMLWHVLERVRRAKLIDKVVIATTNNPKDSSIVDFAKEQGVGVTRGSEDDVLDRVFKAAKSIGADTIVRVTPDCPLIPPLVIDRVISEFLKGGYDYVSNVIHYTYPEGFDVEVFSFAALKKTWKEATNPVYREHVTLYMRDSGRFRIKNVESDDPVDSSKYQLSVDRQEDLEFVRSVFRYLSKKNALFSYNEIINFFKNNYKSMDKQRILNEGYYRSFLKSKAVKARKIKITVSRKLKKKAQGLIPECSQTVSKGPSQFVQGVAPVFLERGKGSHVWDVDGQEYIDYAMALGPVILGHGYPKVIEAVQKVLHKGTTFTLPHKLEIELSELLCDIIPCAEMVRFGKNGSDATSGAVRLARAYTGRDKIACCGYHGWQDWYAATTLRNKGIPEAVRKLTLTFEYNKIETLEKVFAENKNQVACVIMESVGVIEPKDNFLHEVKKLTHKNKALLIFDEVVSGFRFSLGGAQEYFNVIPDLACFGKAMGNGFPISAVVGKRSIMKLFEEVFYSFTFGGEIVSIAAALATIKELKDKKVIPYLWEQGRKLKDGYNVLAKEYGLEKYTRCIGLPPRTIIIFKNEKGEEDLLLKSLFQQECIKRRILFTGAHNICFSHSNKDIDYTLRGYKTVLEIVKDAIKKNKVSKFLKGGPLKPVFRKA